MNSFLRQGVSTVLAAGVVGAAIWAPLSTAQNEDTYKNLKLFGDVFDTVRANYVEEVDDEALIQPFDPEVPRHVQRFDGPQRR